MCIVNNIGDYWNNRISHQYPWITPTPDNIFTINYPTREEFDALKKEMEELKLLLKAAQRYDEQINQPHCEHEDKIALIKKNC